MDPNWPKVKELFSAALALDASERSSFLNSTCTKDDGLRREVLALLAAHESSGNFIQQPAFVDAGFVTGDKTDPGGALVGQQIGSYKVIRELGRGGMGTVYLAARADESFEKRVALKLIKRGMDSDAIIKRFVMERQILANLDHPNIARLIDGGTTEDGLPYFVLEYVEGATITRYCDDHKLNTSERIKLFRSVCSAVQFAHQNLIVHLDLKPSNIIVTADGTPKLLDFGIAKLLNADWSSLPDATETIARLLTPEYASPEQLRGLPMTTTSDVYSLGVVLYELLSGHRPFDFKSRSPEDVARMITTSEPLRPSVMITRQETPNQNGSEQTPEAISRTRDGSIEKLRRRLAGDLDNILLKALRKESERRYPSVQEFSEDLRRHLEGLPVLARPDTLSYRTSKFVARHKTGVAAAAVVLLTLVSATIVTGWQARVARRERDKAERRFNQVRTLANSVLFEYHDGIEKLPGSTPIREKMVKDALVYLDNLSTESSGDPILQAELATAYEKVGNVQGNPYGPNLGNQEGALESYRKALIIRESLYAANHNDLKIRFDLANSERETADVLWAEGHNSEALGAYQKALVLLNELLQIDPKNHDYLVITNLTLSGVAHVQAQNADFKSALDSYEKCLANAEAMLASDPADKSNIRRAAVARLKVGDAWMDFGDYASALPAYEGSIVELFKLAAAAQNNAAATRELGLAYARLALAQAKLKQYDKAVEFYLKALAQQKQVAQADPNNVQSKFDIAATYSDLSDNYLHTRDLNNAALYAREGIAIANDGLLRNPGYLQGRGFLAIGYQTYAEVLLAKGDANAATENYRKALSLLEGESVRDVRAAELAECLSGMGDVNQVRARQTQETARKADLLRETCDWYQKSFDVWQGIDEKGKITVEDRTRFAEVKQKLEQCKAALSR